jgi:hypothetical protein
LSQGDLPGLIAAIKRLFAGVAWRNFIHQDLPETEGYYASVLYAFFASLNAEVIPEDTSNRGQVDLTVKLAGFIYCIEIKVDAADAAPGAEAARIPRWRRSGPRLQRQVPRPAEQGADRAGADLRSARAQSGSRGLGDGGLRAAAKRGAGACDARRRPETFPAQALSGRDPIGQTHRQQRVLRLLLLQCRQAWSASRARWFRDRPARSPGGSGHRGRGWPRPRVSKSQGILDRLLNLPNAAFVSVESACLAQ